jgi:uncharacterized phage protein (TIGR02218 family)
MTFDSRERSLATGRPVRLYDFQRGAQRWTYCSADRDILFQAATWAALAISDDGIRMSGEPSADALKVTAPAGLAVAQLYRAAPPSAEVWLTIRDFHHGEADLVSSSVVCWVGSIAGVRWPELDRCEITCQSLSASMDRPGLHLSWQRSCPHSIYDRECRVDRNLHKVVATLVGVDGVKVSSATFATYPTGHFAGGFIEWPIGLGELERRGVESHSGTDLVLLGGTFGLVPGITVDAYPGCPQTADVCDSKFANIINFGGIRHMPGKSPFDGTPVF